MILRRMWRNITRGMRGGNADCGLPNADCGLKDRSAIRNPQSPIRNRTNRHRPRLEVLEDRTLPANFYVATFGVDAAGRGAPNAPFRSIQFAIDQSTSGDRLHVANGTYTYFDNQPAADASFNFLGVQAVATVFNKRLEIFGGFNNDFSQLNPSAFRTVIDGSNVVRGLFVTPRSPGDPANQGTSLLLDGVTIQNGVARGLAPRGAGNDQIFAFGGGMWINTSANPDTGSFTLRNVTFQNNRAIGNDTGSDGGAGAGGALALRQVRNLTLDRVTFTSNLAQGGSGASRGGGALGGAIHSDGSNWTGSSLTFNGNTAAANNSGANGQDGLGGGVAVMSGSVVTINGTTATGNSALGASVGGQGGASFGGAFYIEGGNLTLNDANIRGNTSRGGNGQSGGAGIGGGIAVFNGAGLNSSLNLNRVQVVNNVAQSGGGNPRTGSVGGGGVYIAATAGTVGTQLLNVLIADNEARFGSGADRSLGGGGGGLWLQGVTANIAHATIANNRLGAGLTFGMGVLLINQVATVTTANISFSIIANHRSTDADATAVEALRLDPIGRNVVNYTAVSMYANNSRDDNSTLATPSQRGQFNGLNNVLRVADAGFIAPGLPNSDYHLLANSPARDAATGSGLNVDADNRARSGTPDLGAFEFFVPAPPPPPPPPAAPARDSVGVVDPQLQWYLRNTNSPGAPDFAVFAYGAPGWVAFSGDWDGNGTFTPGVFDPVTATFYLRNSNSAGGPDAGVIAYGAPTWTPVVGDWDGDGRTTVGMFDPFANWYLRNSNSPGAPDIAVFAYGAGSWQPVVGDWNNDGRTTVGVFDPNGQWYLRNSNTPGGPDAGTFAYGVGVWQPIAGDWDNAASLLAADGPGSGADALSQADLEFAYSAALKMLAATGNALPGSVSLTVGPLGAGQLGVALPAENAITIDDDADGHGWFVDPTPFADEEFDGYGRALADGPAAGRVDLLTAVLHELGHLAGLDDLDAALHPDALMAGTLPVGVRRAAVDAVFGQPGSTLVKD